MNNVEFKQILLNIISDNYGDTQRILKSVCEEFDYDVNNDQWSYISVDLVNKYFYVMNFHYIVKLFIMVFYLVKIYIK